MYHNKTVSVVVPAYNEQKLIARTVETLPDWIDRVIVVDDCSKDSTVEIVRGLMKASDKISLIEHESNKGVGGAICTGYSVSREHGFDVTVVMAGDAQMDPAELPDIVGPVADEGVDYTKGNRLFHGTAWKTIPRYRFIGNSVLSLLTKIASGYWHVADSQCGYTAISKDALEGLDLESVYPRYGVPNDLLIKLNMDNRTVRDIPIRPVYNIGEVSGIRLPSVIVNISRLLVQRFFERLVDKYVIRDFHPMVFFYVFGLIAFPAGFISGAYMFLYRLLIGSVAATSALFAALLILSGLQFLLFAMWLDMEYNKNLKG